VKTKIGERDKSMLVFVDLTKNVVRVRGFFKGKAIIIPLKDSEVKYIKERLNEGASLKLARVYVDKKEYFNVDLVFEKDVEIDFDRVNHVVVDVNAVNYGISYIVITPRTRIENLKPVKRRLDVQYIENLYNKTITLERKCGTLKRLGLKYTEEYQRLRLEAKSCRSKIYRYIRDFYNKLVHEIIQVVKTTRSKLIIDFCDDVQIRKLLEDELPKGLVKIYFAGLRRFVNLLVNQVTWYGIPYEFKNFPSTKCPFCETEMILIKKTKTERIYKCLNCGFIADRDEVPLYWALKILNKEVQIVLVS